MNNSRGTIFLIEDNEDLNQSNRRALCMRGYRVESFCTLAAAKKQLSLLSPDIILLDVMLPDGDGFAFCREIRSHTAAHILFLTAKTQHKDMVRGLSDGGDDYITKPFRLEELLVRVDAAMRRQTIAKKPLKTVQKGALVLDVAASQGFFHGASLGLTPKEFALLFLLMQEEGRLLSAHKLYESVWKAPLMEDKNAVQTALSKLRQKLESTGYTIAMLRNQGYMFCRE